MDKDGTLNISERKKLSMAFTGTALDARRDAKFFMAIVEGLLTRRASVGARFQNVVIMPE